ncbi:alpha/beta hydrolase [Streptomyces iranensis]|uniref:Cephalosporin-C deacetylase-like acetyl esterase n=1 Tax=Streptomyces iranensis TaxID=576784 RepID=A0A060ZJI3_9ACTN|nr:alpha/beta hydrolase [Streptomyces iranensis]MBP2068549.1 cephalosporin-C deacetylase-like acetyl esterase [Streptomyces iranensis]CDR01315.1 dipeptidyl aminopeptidase/acylaminoacyl-peptidase-like protein [Streptomyces iranensis]
MTVRSAGQSWALDIALAQGGFDALHPAAKGTMEQLGHDHTDFDKVFAQVKSGAMLPKAWATVAAQAEERAAHHEVGGYARTAADLYVRAAVMWGRAQYSIFDADDPRKMAFRERCNHCVARLGALRDDRVRRVVLDFEGKKIYALLHLPAGEVRDAPAVLLGPGMDMIKEDYIYAAERYYTSHGIVALSIEGPGQGESRASGLTVDLTNYERAISRYLDFLSDLPEVDAQRIGMFGISMSGYWGLRAAATDSRLAAMAGFEGVTGDFETIFGRAQPTFKSNYMYMAGYADEDLFDAELARRMPLGDLVADITCPVFMGIGEFDELTQLEQALATYERVRAPKEMRVYENEFHPLGGTAAEVFRFGAEWLERALAGELSTPGRDVRHYVHDDGRTTDGTACPSWWLGTTPRQIAEAADSAASAT